MKFDLAIFVKYLKRTNLILGSFLVVLAVIALANSTPEKAKASFTASSVAFPAKNSLTGQIIQLNAQGTAEDLSPSGVYSVTYTINNPSGTEVSFPLVGAIHRCKEGNGHVRQSDGAFPVCEQVDAPYTNFNIHLNSANGFTQAVTLSTEQPNYQPCGSFQSDIFSNTPTPNANGFFYASTKFTGVDCLEPTPTPHPSMTPEPTPTPEPSKTPYPTHTPYPSYTPTPYPSQTPYPTYTPTPTPTPYPSMTPEPTPTPSSTPMPGQCPTGQIHKIINSTIVCVSQDQSQNQTQEQNNNQNQNVNQNVNAQGGSSSSSSSSSSNNNVQINTYDARRISFNHSPEEVSYIYSDYKNPQVLGYKSDAIYIGAGDKGYTPQVLSQAKSSITELPRTGLPLLALGLAGTLPGGLLIKRLSRKKNEESENSVWTKRQLQK